MADKSLTQLLTGATWPNGYATSGVMLMVDVTDTTMSSSGTDKGITVADWIAQYFHAGSNVTITPGSTGVTIASSGGGAVSSVFALWRCSGNFWRLHGFSGYRSGSVGVSDVYRDRYFA